MLKSWTLLTQRVGDLPIQIYLMNPIPSIMIPHIRSHPKVWDMTGRPTSRTLWRRRSMGSWPALLASGRRCRRPWTMDRRTVGGAQVCGLYIYLVIYMWDIYHIYQDFPWVSSIAMLFHGRIKRLRKPWKMPKKVLVISMKRWSRSQARNGRLTSQRIPVLPKKSRFVNALAHLLIKTNFGTSFYEINQCLNQVQQFSSIFFSNLIVPAGLVWSMRGVGISCL